MTAFDVNVLFTEGIFNGRLEITYSGLHPLVVPIRSE